MTELIEKRERLADPVATTGDRVYIICSQNGLFPDPWQGHVPHEMWGIWDHPIKLLDGCWFAVRSPRTQVTRWLTEADCCRVGLGYTEFVYQLDALQVTRRDFVPDGLEGCCITVTLSAPADWHEALELVVVVRSDLRPAWLGEQVGLHDAPDQVTLAVDRRQVTFADVQNPWFALVGADLPATTLQTDAPAPGFTQTHGQGCQVQLTLPFTPELAGSVTRHLLIAGSSQSLTQAQSTFARLQAEQTALVQAKQAHYQQISQTSQLCSPDEMINTAFQWVKLNCQMLARFTPTHGLGVGAGLPTYPWWFGIDTLYAVLPMLQAGLFDLTKASLRLLKQVSMATNPNEIGRVIHELSTTGVVYNAGNLVETPLFTRAVHQTWLWTGDDAFLHEMYPFCKQGLLDYTLGSCDPDGDLCPSGRSIIETLEMHAGFECLDVAAYTWEALGCLAEMAQAVGEADLIPELQAKAQLLGQRLQNEWWVADENLFADVRASITEVRQRLGELDVLAQQQPTDVGVQQQVTQAHHLFDPLLTKHASADPDVDLPWLLRHWVVFCPVEVGLATPTQATALLQRLATPEFCNQWGMYLHPDRHDVMSINSGLLALAQMRYGQVDTALTRIQAMAQTLDLHMPGAISEALPDQWCFLQLWSAMGIISPVVEGIFGLEPRASEHRLRVVVHLPTDWEEAELRQVCVGTAQFRIHASRQSQRYTLTVTTDAPDYQVEVGFVLPSTAQVASVTLNGQPADWRWQQGNAGRALVCAAQGNVTLVIE